MHIPRRHFLWICGSAIAAPTAAWSQTYPTRPVLFVVPLAAGGGPLAQTTIVSPHARRCG
jgi:tripartite-type tricarboxylate transporter receptor subunit TctC